jgi:hypothetical protein
MAIKLHTVGASETNLKHYVCVSGQNHLVISTPGLKNNMGFRTAFSSTSFGVSDVQLNSIHFKQVKQMQSTTRVSVDKTI